MAPNPVDNEELYNSIILGGVASPGVVTLSGHDRKIGWDIKKGPGTAGASMTRTSEDPIEFTASFYLVKDDSLGVDDIGEWPEFLALINSTIAGPNPKALDIYHPDLAEQDITSVVKGTVLGVVHDGLGGQRRAVKFLEYKPPKKAGGSPNGSAATKKKDAAPDPNADALAELARLTNQYQNTPWG